MEQAMQELITSLQVYSAESGKQGAAVIKCKNAVSLYGSKSPWSKNPFKKGHLKCITAQDEQVFFTNGQPSETLDDMMVAILLYANQAQKRAQAAAYVFCLSDERRLTVV